jgi:predicted thioesterase
MFGKSVLVVSPMPPVLITVGRLGGSKHSGPVIPNSECGMGAHVGIRHFIPKFSTETVKITPKISAENQRFRKGKISGVCNFVKQSV